MSVEGDLEPQVLKIVCDDWDLVRTPARNGGAFDVAGPRGDGAAVDTTRARR